jgi:lipopolysaccharide heptosyltransferase II
VKVAQSWNEVQNVVCVRLDSIGDVLMTTPAIRALKQSLSGCNVTLLTSSIGAEVAALISEVDHTIPYDAPWMKAAKPRETSRAEFDLVNRLHAEHFDAAVIFTVFSQNPLPAAFLCYLAEIPLRLAHCHENPYRLLSNWLPDPEPSQLTRHEVQRQLDLVASVGCRTQDARLSLRVPELARLQVCQMLDASGIPIYQPWIVIHPGATAASRRYRPEGYAQAADRLVTEFGLPVVFTGTDVEVDLINMIRNAMHAPVISLAGQLNLAQLAALIELTPLLITNNTGSAHIAAALGTPVVDLYALTNLQHTPWQVPNRILFHDVPCKPCFKSICPEGHHECLTLVSSDQVVQAALELLGETLVGKNLLIESAVEAAV